ncbi:MAG: hypothetical protein M3419_07125 [Actinomycetota bacterium]|nr:hypothetical protein [Actinomycetota bacterium]
MRRRRTRTLVSVRRHQPALDIRLAGSGYGYDQLVIGADDAEAQALLTATG